MKSYKDNDGDVPFIGAQWNANKATREPPDAFHNRYLKYRSVIIKTFP